MTPAPTLQSKRLTLRGPQRGDLAPFTQMVTTSPRMAALGGNGTEMEAWRSFISGIGHWNWHGYGFFKVCVRDSGAPLGRVGILNHVAWPQPELAWHVFDGAEGKGIAYEAALVVRDWFGRAHDKTPLISLIAEENSRSRKLAARLGAVAKGKITVDGEEALLHRHLPFDDDRAIAQLSEVTP